MQALETKTDSRSITWALNKKGRWEILCRTCLKRKADFFDVTKSTYVDGEGWVDEWHMCTPCARKEWN